MGLSVMVQFGPTVKCQHLHLFAWGFLWPPEPALPGTHSKVECWETKAPGEYPASMCDGCDGTRAPVSGWDSLTTAGLTPATQSTTLLRDGYFPSRLLSLPPYKCCDCVPNKPPPLESLSEGLLLEEPKLRQLAEVPRWKRFRTKTHDVMPFRHSF